MAKPQYQQQQQQQRDGFASSAAGSQGRAQAESDRLAANYVAMPSNDVRGWQADQQQPRPQQQQQQQYQQPAQNWDQLRMQIQQQVLMPQVRGPQQYQQQFGLIAPTSDTLTMPPNNTSMNFVDEAQNARIPSATRGLEMFRHSNNQYAAANRNGRQIVGSQADIEELTRQYFRDTRARTASFRIGPSGTGVSTAYFYIGPTEAEMAMDMGSRHLSRYGQVGFLGPVLSTQLPPAPGFAPLPQPSIQNMPAGGLGLGAPLASRIIVPRGGSGIRGRERGSAPRGEMLSGRRPRQPKLRFPEGHCQNCGLEGHEVLVCMRPTKIGDFMVCLACGGANSHGLEDCQAFKSLTREAQLDLIIDNRAGRPGPRMTGEPWVLRAAEELATTGKPSALYPWSKSYAREQNTEEDSKDRDKKHFWETWDYQNEDLVGRQDPRWDIKNVAALISALMASVKYERYTTTSERRQGRRAGTLVKGAAAGRWEDEGEDEGDEKDPKVKEEET